MWNPVILILATIATTLTVCEVESRSLHDIDVESILNVLQQQHQNENHHSQYKHSDSLDSKSSDEAVDNEDNSHYGSLKSPEIIDLIEQATHNKNVNDIFDYKILKGKKKRVIHKHGNFQDADDRNNKMTYQANVPVDERMIKQILSYLQSQAKPKKKPRKQAIKKQKLLSNLFKSMKIQGEGHDRAQSKDSKIYIILNPHAIQKSSSKNSLNDLILKLSSLSSASLPKDYAEVRKDQQYKGFPVKEGVFSRRVRRDSKEKYDPKDSIEDNYKQKRLRNDHGSGRTAIPYIRHRGDVYEKDN